MSIEIFKLSHGTIIKTASETIKNYLINFFGGLEEYEKAFNKRLNITEVTKLGSRGTFTLIRDKEQRYTFGILNTDYDEMIRYINRRPKLVSEKDEMVITDLTGETNLGVPSEFKMGEKWKPRNEAQQEAVNFVLEENKHNRILHADTGFGKTFCGFYAGMQYGRRMGMCMEPQHFLQWIEKYQQYGEDKDLKRIIKIAGTAQLEAYLELALEGNFDYDVILISAPTFREYIKKFEGHDSLDVPVPPWEVFATFGIGLLIRDEAHEALFATVKQTIYSNVSKIVFLSATLVEDINTKQNIYPKLFPPVDRWESPVNKHIFTIPLFYNQMTRKPIKFMGAKGYSHIKYEQGILKKALLKKSYLDLISSVVSSGWAKIKQVDGKLLIFCSLTEMCEVVSDHLQGLYPDLKVNFFIAKTDKKVLTESDIIVSTPKSCGTGKDIPCLEAVILTIGIGSEGLSRQVCGRLRPYSNKAGEVLHDVHPRFYYLINSTIPSHLYYHQTRMMYMRKRSWKIQIGRLNRILTDR